MTPIEVVMRVSRDVEPSGQRVVRGWDVGIPGLAITEGKTVQGERCWGATHIASGFKIIGAFLSPEAAYAHATALADVDWTKPAIDLVDDPDVRTAVRAAAEQYRPDVRCGGGLAERHALEAVS